MSFLKDVDYIVYLDKLREASAERHLDIHSDEDLVHHAAKHLENLHRMASRRLNMISFEDKLTKTDTKLGDPC